MPDFSLATMPNFAQAALSGYQAGSAQAKQNQIDSALSGIDLERPETLLPVLRADPSTGAPLIGASVKMHAENRAQQAQAALGDALGRYFGGGTGSGANPSDASAPPSVPTITAAPTPSNPLAPSVPAVPSGVTGAPTDADGNIVVTAHPAVAAMPPTLQQTVGNLVRNGVSLDDAAQFVNIAGKMTKTQADALNDQQEALSAVATAIPKGASLTERQAFIASHRDFLLSHNVPAAKIDSFVPTDQNISAVQTMALGTKDALTQAREAAQAAETAKQHGIENGFAGQRIGLERQNVAIAGGHLAIARSADARAAAAAGAAGTAKAPVAQYIYRTGPDGKIQRKLVQ